MPSGTPKIGHSDVYTSKNPKLSSAAEELLNSPEPKHLGSINLAEVDEVPPPPWEVDPRSERHNTDARRFVTVPDNWELRWVNPRVLSVTGWRDWQAVAASDPRIQVLNRSMVAPDNTIRRGGHEGDVLAWMYKSWVESRTRLKVEKAAKAAGQARDRMEAAKEAVSRGEYGRYVSVTDAHHPTHTTGDGRTMKD